MQLKNLLKRNVTGTDRWHHQNTLRGCEWPRCTLHHVSAYANTGNTSEAATDAIGETCELHQCCAGFALGTQYQEMLDEVYVDVASDRAQCPQTRWWSYVLGQALARQLLSPAHDIVQQC